MKTFSEEWWKKNGVKTIPVGCDPKLLTKTEIEDQRYLKRSQKEWWEQKYGGNNPLSIHQIREIMGY